MERTSLTGVILAGGKSTRMGGQDKGLLLLQDKPLWEHVADRLRGQTNSLAISANRHIEQYCMKEYPVITDKLTGFQGPLAGMLTAMQTLRSEWFLFCPCDTPFIPDNLAEKLWHSKTDAPTVWAYDGERDHPTVSLLHHSLTIPLMSWLKGDDRRVMAFLRSMGGHAVFFKDAQACFTNVNTPEDLQYWEKK